MVKQDLRDTSPSHGTSKSQHLLARHSVSAIANANANFLYLDC